jgi:hypothetical protein
MKPTPRVVIDIIATVIYIICANPLITGLAIHEWLSLGIVVIFIVHIAINGDTIVATIKRKATSGTAALLNLLLDVALTVCFIVVTVSGILISNHILPTFGLYAQGYWIWMPIHAVSAKVLLALLIVHVAAHIKWILALLSRKKDGSLAASNR